jgi:hypothetical protein
MERETYEQPAVSIVQTRCMQVLMGSARGEQRDAWDDEE